MLTFIFRVAILYSDRDEKDKNGSDIMDADRLVLKGAPGADPIKKFLCKFMLPLF